MIEAAIHDATGGDPVARGAGLTGLRPVMTLEQAGERLKEFQAFVHTQMVEGVDYGKIPGTDRPTLLLPGAQKLADYYGLAVTVPEISRRLEDWSIGLFHYEVKVRLVLRSTGEVVADGLASCNSKEDRYAYRWVWANEIPEGTDRDQLIKRSGTSKRTGQPYTQYRVDNAEPYTLVNTILKMAKKRAFVDAVVYATRSSGMFNQDVEDWADAEAPKPARPAPKAEQKPEGKAPVPQDDERPAPASEAIPNDPATGEPYTHRALVALESTLAKKAVDLGVVVPAVVGPASPQLWTSGAVAARIRVLKAALVQRATAGPVAHSPVLPDEGVGAKVPDGDERSTLRS